MQAGLYSYPLIPRHELSMVGLFTVYHNIWPVIWLFIWQAWLYVVRIAARNLSRLCLIHRNGSRGLRTHITLTASWAFHLFTLQQLFLPYSANHGQCCCPAFSTAHSRVCIRMPPQTSKAWLLKKAQYLWKGTVPAKINHISNTNWWYSSPIRLLWNGLTLFKGNLCSVILLQKSWNLQSLMSK